MTRCSTLRSAALAGTFVVVLAAAGTATAEAATNQQVHMSANLSTDAGSGAVTYDPQLAPSGATLAVDMIDAGEGDTKVSLTAQGLEADHDYAAWAGVNPCGSAAADAGAHFRNAADANAAGASTGPDDVALSLHTDANGDGTGETDVPFSFDTRSPGSVVLQEAGTSAAAACITLPTS